MHSISQRINARVEQANNGLKLLALLVLVIQPLAVFAQGTAFTYQGSLTDGGNPATGTYDLRFTLFDSTNLPGTVVAGPLTNSPTGVTNGLFAVTLDFGAVAFDGSGRWLEIAARTNLGGSGSFSTLSPRQKITSTPYATRAANAGVASGVTPGGITAAMLAPGAVSSLDSPNGSNTGVLRVANSGLVGLGTSAPQAGLDVAGGKTISVPRLLNVLVDETRSFTNLAGECAVAVKGNLLAISAQDDNALTLCDITNPTNVVMLSSIRNGTGSFTNLGGPFGAVWSGNLLAISANNDSAVTLVDTTTPAAPVWRSVLRDGIGGFNDLAGAAGLNLTSNILAIAALTDNAVTLVDVSNPAAPVLRVTIKDGTFGFNDLGGAAGLARQGNLLAVAAANDNAVTLIDISNPANPVLRAVIRNGVGPFTNLSGAFGLAFSGNILAIGAFADGAVTLVDVSNPSSPVFLSSVKDGVAGFEGLSSAAQIAFQGSTLWVASQDSAVTALDVGNPSAPLLKSVVRNATAGFSHLKNAFSVALHGNVLVAGASSAVNFLDTSTTAQVGLLSAQWVGIGVTQPKAALDVRGNVLVEGAQAFDVHTITAAIGDSLASGSYATALGQSSASGDYAVAMGSATASGRQSTASGNGIASGDYSTAFALSTASGNRSTASGQSVASGQSSVALGVSTAAASGAVALGSLNEANGIASVALGESCVANTNYTFALGHNARANHIGSFVWADSQFADFASSTNNQFLIRAAGGVGIGKANPATALDVNGTVTATAFSGSGAIFNGGRVGIGTFAPSRELEVQNSGDVEIGLKSTDANAHLWTLQSSGVSGSSPLDATFQIIDRTLGGTRLLIGTNGNVGIGTTSPTNKLHVSGGVSATAFITTSDRNAKENFAPISPSEVLAKVAGLPITTWNFKEMPGPRHMGPMAQDFYAAFGLGGSDRTITTIDPDGVALVAIQGLNDKVDEKEKEITELKRALRELTQLVHRLDEKLDDRSP